MTNNNIQLSKIVANATPNSWSQAYSTANLYIVIDLSLDQQENPHHDPVASIGKRVFEQLQREFFALEKKSLSEIKKAVEQALEILPVEGCECSLALASASGNVLYIATFGKAAVILKRGDITGIPAQGERATVKSFSGYIQTDDTVILETEGFFKKIPVSTISQLIGKRTPTEIAENIAPILHEGAQGTETAIILKIGNQVESAETPVQDTITEESDEEKTIKQEPLLNSKKQFSPKFRLPAIQITPFLQKIFSGFHSNPFGSRRKLILGIGIVVLCIALGVGIWFERKNEQEKAMQAAIESKISNLQKQYDTATAIIGTNDPQAIHNLSELKDEATSDEKTLKLSKDQKKRIDTLISLANDKLYTLAGNISPQDQKIVFQATSSLTSINAITCKSGTLAIGGAGTGSIFLVPAGQSSQQLKTSENEITALSEDDSSVYAVSKSTIVAINKKTGKETSVYKIPQGNTIAAVDTFSGNVYGLDQTNNDILKFPSPSFQKSSYFKDSSALSVTPNSMTIDGSIWILNQTPAVLKFTRGAQGNFSVQNLQTPFEKNATIYTDTDFKNLYILDPDTKRVIILDKNGVYQNQINIPNLSDIKSFCVNESTKIVFIATASTVYSFNF